MRNVIYSAVMAAVKLSGIIGSSNFTGPGLTSNAELNSLEDDPRTVTYKPQGDRDHQGHLSWFDGVWERAEEWNGDFQRLFGQSSLGQITYSPYEMYMKTCMEIFEDDTTKDEIEVKGSTEIELYHFQKENAQNIYNKLEKNRLAMLADSVGLGKTITAGAVINHYARKQKCHNICVLGPPSLARQWQSELYKFYKLRDDRHYRFVSFYNLTEIEAEAEKYDGQEPVDLFVVDESHNLRNEGGKRYKAILKWFEKSPGSRVLLMTATPVNNHLKDLTGQIRLGRQRFD